MMSFNNTRTLTHSEQQHEMDALNTKKRRSSNISISSSGDEDEEKRERRRVANRKASVACRLRKKIFINELQRQISELTKRNAEIEEENALLRKAFEQKAAAERQTQQQQQLNSTNFIQLPPMTRLVPTSSYDFSLQCSRTPVTDASSTVTMSPAPPSPRPSKEELYAALIKTALAEYRQQRRVAVVEQRAFV